jgi:hypothetical protein
MIDRLTAALDIARGPHGSVYTGQLLADDLADVLAVVALGQDMDPQHGLGCFYDGRGEPCKCGLLAFYAALAKLEGAKP